MSLDPKTTAKITTNNRVWDLVTGARRNQFSPPSDRLSCTAYTPAPRPPAAHGFEVEERHLAAGYASGAVRVFHVPSTSTLFKLEQHWSATQQVCTYACAFVEQYRPDQKKP